VKRSELIKEGLRQLRIWKVGGRAECWNLGRLAKARGQHGDRQGLTRQNLTARFSAHFTSDLIETPLIPAFFID
jgi:hypothetical protein